MSSTDPAWVIRATTTAPSLQTPYVEANVCHTPYNLVTVTADVSGAATRGLALVAGPDNEHFDYCQPPGWEGDSTSSILAFSPAVCPTYWPMHHVTAHETVVSGTSTRTVTTAYCCDKSQTVYPTGVSGLGIEFFSSNPACVSTWSRNSSRTIYLQPNGTTGAYVTFTEGPLVRPAWRISWEETDRKILKPMPPSLTPGQSLASWSPTPEPYSGGHSCTAEDPCESPYLSDLLPMIAVPSSVGFALVVGIIICCVVARKRKKKRERKARELTGDAVPNDDQK
ncbi:hypothetical protein CTA2_8536 [Colletotrichum tanaceti]|uniref:Uncharacterized protein n=1 Tax=Colletotrichum tanaceti TaxID=1306861 RepID=A0A4U6XJS1_9PEZI|nr:hypothetical protein CTA2_8543 [Colletotrichum tanaceti]KAJ0168206.1 hypothetical protein CTA2_8536 [Colletotrichum tanaceti]TKW55974.1 hypothetical protein CTA1_11370 [Colletotrichum tanaceti]